MRSNGIYLSERHVKMALIERDLKQSELAELSGLSLSYINQIILGRRTTQGSAQKIADALHKDLSDLVESKATA
jgi:transcriptional regulator with XRE-family HTH domain